VTLYAGAQLGNGSDLARRAVIGSDGFGLRARRRGSVGNFRRPVKCDWNDVEIGANTTVDRGSLDRTEISAGVKIDNLVHIAHNVRIGRKHCDCRTNWNLSFDGDWQGRGFWGQAGLGDHA